MRPANAVERDHQEQSHWFGGRGKLRWPDLLDKPRVVILAGGGAGKTAEIRQTAKRLDAEGKPAFFLRIEHLRSDFEGAFEVGTYVKFQDWIQSGEEGWVFLDSVDEARLRGPKEFEQAIKRIARELRPALQRAHIIITGREAAWRSRSDQDLCQDQLPYEAPPRVWIPAVSADELTLDNASDFGSDEGDAEPSLDGLPSEAQETHPNSFVIVTLDPLYGTNIAKFVSAQGVTNADEFQRAVERRDVGALTARPLDLEELAEYWKSHGSIGSHRELIEASITHRLSEPDPDRAQATELTSDRLREGIQLLAAAATLTQQSDIRLPGALVGVQGIEPHDVLNWSESDIATLLGRPIFDGSIHGAVRFHVRRVREYLTAEWLHGLLVRQASRVPIEALCFRIQYGREVVVPTMRGVLPWLALFDDRILERIRRVAPDVMFEGGDPSQLPLEMRSRLLDDACRQLADAGSGRSLTDFQAVQRFAAPDLAQDIKRLLAAHGHDDEVVYFIMRMIWQGEIRDAAAEALQVALTASGHATRIVAIRALVAVGHAEDQAKVRTALLAQPGDVDRDWLKETLVALPRNAAGVDWLLDALSRAANKRRFSIDELSDAIEEFTEAIPNALLPRWLDGLQQLLSSPPLKDDSENRVSTRYEWLLGAAIVALRRLVEARDAHSLAAAAMHLLCVLPVAVVYGDDKDRKDSAQLGALVAAWPEINYALLWAGVAYTRERQLKKNERVTNVWSVGALGHYWQLTANAFDVMDEAIATRAILDDRLVALSAAVAIYHEHGRSQRWRRQLQRRVRGEAELEAELSALLNPNTEQRRQWKKREAQWKRRAARESAAMAENRRKWITYLQDNFEDLRKPASAEGILKSQHYLSTRLREVDKNSSRWADGRWRALIPEFGTTVAEAYRDGAVATWRVYRPVLLSEGAKVNSTALATIHGLTGLLIESRETPNWETTLSANEAAQAARYAMCELNGLSPWLPNVFAEQPDAVVQVVLGEIDYELRSATPVSPSQYVLSDVSSVGSWIWDRIAPGILSRLRRPQNNTHQVRQQLVILAGSSVADADIAALAKVRAGASESDELAALWFAAWAGVDPDAAILAFAAHLAGLATSAQQTNTAMHFLTCLVGGRRARGLARECYRSVHHLRALYLLMHQYIDEREDLDRAGGGVYSPGLRDDAQDAREVFLTQLKDMAGQEAYRALQDIALHHPSTRGRNWVAGLAQKRAETDADSTPWQAAQVRDFHEHLERVPSTHRDMHDLAVARLEDLKHELEDGETSIAAVLLTPVETEVRNVVASWCRDRGLNRYFVAQEEEFADRKRTDIRFLSTHFDGPVPVELKLANQWPGPVLAERLENQLCNDYLRDQGSNRGIFLLMYQGGRHRWEMADGTKADSFEALVVALQRHWDSVAATFEHVEEVRIIGIDLTKRAKPKGRSTKPAKATGASGKRASKSKPTAARLNAVKPGTRSPQKKATGKRIIAKKVMAQKATAKKAQPRAALKLAKRTVNAYREVYADGCEDRRRPQSKR
jgi:hypothetical protein